MTPAEPTSLRLILDVGTHKVLGLVTRPAADGGVEIVASSLVRHPERAMRDGQVHDVRAVARTLARVRAELEERAQVTFAEAYIAAAGRALRTVRGRAEVSFPQRILFDEEKLQLLEWEALADAQQQLQQNLPESETSLGYYCIAHSPVVYRLDGDPIGSLVGQRGETFAVELLATFLPGAVVDSLETSLARAGLAMAGLTLEPIAALEAVIPPSSRHLNLVLVDVGAGTSDIALTGGGTVQAFGMIPQAGDAITEAVSEAFLLDFAVAEYAKRTAASGSPVTVENALGEEVQITPELLEEAIRDATRQLAARIASEIAGWLQKPPSAVIMVGGGSRTPGLAQAVAEQLGLPANRVAVRDRRAVRGVSGDESLEGPETITALGIALRATRGIEMPPVRARVNGRPVCLFLPDRRTVGEAVRIAGIHPREITGKIGRGLSLTVNGQVLIVPGTRGEPARIQVNGTPASLDTVLHNHDEVHIEPGTDGQPPRVQVGDIVRQWLDALRAEGRQPPRICWNGTWQEVPVWVERRGAFAGEHEPVQDRDVLEIRFARTAAELLHLWGQPAPATLHCWVNDRPVALPARPGLLRNGQPAEADEPVEDGDRWSWGPADPATVRDALVAAGVPASQPVALTLNGNPIVLDRPVHVTRNGEPASLGDPVAEGDRLFTAPPQAPTLYELLPHAGLPPALPPDAARRLVLKIGDKTAGFTSPIREGDHVVIRYDEAG